MKTQVDIKLLNGSKQEVAYETVETVGMPLADGSGEQVFTAGKPLDNIPIVLDFANGDQQVEAPKGYVVRSAVIAKPEGVEQVIAKGVTAAGIVGEYVTPGTTKEIDPNFSQKTVEEEVLPLTTYSDFALNSAYGIYAVDTEVPYILTIGETYFVVWDGETYECVCQDASALHEGGVVLGNGAGWGLSGNSEPFAIATVNQGAAITGSLTDIETGGSHTIRIYQVKETGDMVVTPSEEDERWNAVVVKMPEALLPENVAKDVEIAGVKGTHTGGGGPLMENEDVSEDVIFYDMDGTVVFRCTIEEAHNLTELPTPPEHAGFTFQEWNHTLDEVINTTHPLDIGANYITTDWETVLVTSSSVGISGVSGTGTVKLNFYQSESECVYVSVDGGAKQRVSGTGNVSISIPNWSSSAWSKTITFQGTPGTYFYFVSFTGFTSGSYTLTPSVKSLAVGGYYSLSTTLSSGWYENIPVGITSATKITSVTKSNQLRAKCCVIPRTVTTMTADPCNQQGCQVVSFPRNMTSAYGTSAKIERFIYPDAMTSCTLDAKFAKYVCFPDNATTVQVNGENLQKFRLPPGPFTLSRVNAEKLARFTVPARATIALTGTSTSALFYNCYNLREIVWENCTLSNTVASGTVFYMCWKLLKLTLPTGVTSISGTFGTYCSAADALIIPEGVTSTSFSIGSYTQNCLQMIVLPSTVTAYGSIGLGSNTYNMRAIVYLSDVSFNVANAFTGTGYRWNVYVRDELVDEFLEKMSTNVNFEDYKTRLKPLSSLPIDLSALLSNQ